MCNPTSFLRSQGKLNLSCYSMFDILQKKSWSTCTSIDNNTFHGFELWHTEIVHLQPILRKIIPFHFKCHVVQIQSFFIFFQVLLKVSKKIVIPTHFSKQLQKVFLSLFVISPFSSITDVWFLYWMSFK